MVLCGCGCGEATNLHFLRVLELRAAGVDLKSIAIDLGVTYEYAKAISSKAKRGEWPRFKKGHHRNDSSLPTKECEFPPCLNRIPGFWHHCTDQVCQSARLSFRWGLDPTPEAAYNRVLDRIRWRGEYDRNNAPRRRARARLERIARKAAERAEAERQRSTEGSRAVLRTVDPSKEWLTPSCAGCDKIITGSQRAKKRKVVCNVYQGGRWDRVEHWHLECYQEAGQPYGEPRTL